MDAGPRWVGKCCWWCCVHCWECHAAHAGQASCVAGRSSPPQLGLPCSSRLVVLTLPRCPARGPLPAGLRGGSGAAQTSPSALLSSWTFMAGGVPRRTWKPCLTTAPGGWQSAAASPQAAGGSQQGEASGLPCCLLLGCWPGPHSIAVLLGVLALRALLPLCRIANRLRALLPEAERASLEQSLAGLAPLFDLAAPLPADAAPLPADASADVAAAGGAELAPATREAVAAGHALLEELAAAGCERADALAQAAADSAAQLVAPPAAAAAPSTDSAPDTEAAAAGQAAAEAPPPGGSQPAAAPAAIKALAGLHADGVKSVAELCSLCLERLLALGRSLSSFYRYGRPADDGIVWPPASEACGLLLRGQALRQLEDLQAMAAAFGAALASAGGTGACWSEGWGTREGWGAAPALGAALCGCFAAAARPCQGPQSSRHRACLPFPPTPPLQATSWTPRLAAGHTALQRRPWPRRCRGTARPPRRAFRTPAARCCRWCG